jgi:hypothetical protein
VKPFYTAPRDDYTMPRVATIHGGPLGIADTALTSGARKRKAPT